MFALLPLIVGGLVVLVGSIWFLVTAFRQSLPWGLGGLLYGPVQLVFLILYWRVAARPFLLQLLGA
jgi:hypothetical protein